jgi:ubiquinone/menaquinone biosynthesis C-methylase UbiE
MPHVKPPAEVLAYYDQFPEESRLGTGSFQLEFARTKEILERLLPRPPARIVDVGGAAGAYSGWLAGRGYAVQLVDASERLVDEARKRNASLAEPIESLTVGDARSLPQADGSADVVLIMGPLYHLTSQADRLRALSEAMRVLVPSGLVVVAGISRYASTMAAFVRQLALDPAFTRIRNQDLANGQHRNDTGRIDYFTTAYLHRPEDLRAELEAAGFGSPSVLGVEGPGWILTDFDERWNNAALQNNLVDVARALEAEPSVTGASAHLLGFGRKPR